jgi:CPA2 family monovalent cation:H+ antiporter-2
MDWCDSSKGAFVSNLSTVQFYERASRSAMTSAGDDQIDDAHGFLQTLAVVLCAAAVTTVLFQRSKQPVVLGYLLAGMVVGPYIPIPIQAESHTVEALAELGVILLMFSPGITSLLAIQRRASVQSDNESAIL